MKKILSLLFILYTYNASLSSLSLFTTKSPQKKEASRELAPRHDTKLEKHFKRLHSIFKKINKKKYHYREAQIEKMFSEAFISVNASTRVVELDSSFTTLANLTQELKAKDLPIFFKGKIIRNTIQRFYSLLDRVNENGFFMRGIKKEHTTRDNVPFIFSALHQYLFLLSATAKISSFIIPALQRSTTQRAARLNQTMIGLLLDLRHISMSLNTLKNSLKASHGSMPVFWMHFKF